MAIKTKTELRTYWNSAISTNGSQAITGSVMNVGGIDIIDSMAMGTEVVGKVRTGYGTVAESGTISWSFSPNTANTWEKMAFGTPQQQSTMKNMTYNSTDNELLVHFAELADDEPIEVSLDIFMALNPNTVALRTIHITHGVDSVVNSDQVWDYAHISDENRISGHITPLSYHWKGLVPNRKGISIWIKSTGTSAIVGRGRVLTASAIHLA